MRRPHISHTSLQTVSSYISIFMHIPYSKCCFAENFSNPLSTKNPKPWSSKSLDLGPGSMFFKGWIATTHVVHPIFRIYPRPGFSTRISSSGMGNSTGPKGWMIGIWTSKRSNKISIKLMLMLLKGFPMSVKVVRTSKDLVLMCFLGELRQ